MNKIIHFIIILFVFLMCDHTLLYSNLPLIIGTGKSIQGSRDYQQDCFYLAKNVKNPLLALICDGHGDLGDFVSEEIKEQLIKKLDNAHFVDNTTENIKKIKDVFSEVNTFLQKNIGKDGNTSGTTCIALLHIKNNFYLAHVGDSRAVWGIKKEEQTFDHTGSNKDEINRVGAHNIYGPQKRLGGTLMVTRAFGDFALIKNGLIAEPEVIVLPMDMTPFIILGCDGIWDGSSTKLSYSSTQTDDNSLVYSLMYNTIITQKESVEIACKRILVAAICSTLQDRATPLLNLFLACPESGNIGLLLRKIAPVKLNNAVAKIDPHKKEMILSLSLAQINDFIKENQKYAHDNTTVICIHNKQAEITPVEVIKMELPLKVVKNGWWNWIKKWWYR